MQLYGSTYRRQQTALAAIIIGYPAKQPEPKDKWKPENVLYNEFGGKAE
jgi:hypothetical protein